MSAVHFGRTSNPLKLVFLHATGFNAFAYKSLLEPMGIHAVAIDLRGHGMSELPIDPENLRNWHIHRDDITAFLQTYVDRPVVLAGHSSGAVTSILAAEYNREKVSGVVAFDPPTMPWPVRMMPYIPGGKKYTSRRFPIARNAGKRRAVFPDLETAFNRYQGRGTFKGVSDEALRDYLEGGMKPHADGMQLTCDPKWEQAMFVAQGHSIFKAARKAPEHVRVLYAGKDSPSTKGTRKKLARILGEGKVETLPDLRHFFPFHEMDFTRQVLTEMIKIVSLAR
ncbi:MAG: alpha/beta hydrolase [Hyphomonadaceae bacterium]|nr:alpha/beta hydrolase [Hyphomonadaceae bacterium]